jgi:CHAT domain-containing protein
VAVRELSEAVLTPLRDRLEGRRRLVVLADGALHLVPFAALPFGDEGEPLVARLEVVSLPSATVLAMQRKAAASRPVAEGVLAALADPVVDGDDRRLSGHVVEPEVDGDLQRSLDDLDLDSLPRLPGSKGEAEAIVGLVPRRQALLATGFAANRKLVVEGKLGPFRIVHFATHGLVNPVHPGLSGIVLSLYDREGRPQEGFLRVADVAELDLQADLVVLSACQTAAGPELRGEGMVGLVDAMFAAGSQRVVASLWKVNDAPTRELMEELYERLLVDAMPPGAALREAQLATRRAAGGERLADWAAFQLYGDWRPISNLPRAAGVGVGRADDPALE